MPSGGHIRHGFGRRGKRDRFYVLWLAMMGRCGTPTNRDYYLYGGRGIYVCEEWKKPEEFVAWCQKQNSPKGYSIDRFPDPDGPYAPWNCRFASIADQVRNRSMSIWVSLNGERLVLKDAVAKYGQVSYSCAKARVRIKKWTPEDAVLVKPHSRVSRKGK